MLRGPGTFVTRSLVACALGCDGGGRTAVGETGATVLEQLERANVERTTAGRLSIRTTYRGCTPRDSTGGSIPLADCGERPPRSAHADGLALGPRAAAAVRLHGDAAALHAAALVDLVWSGADVRALDRAVELLQSVARLDPARAAPLADLSAALLARAERRQDARDLVEALEAAALALAVDPAHVPASFNLALALDRLALDTLAAGAWARAAELDPASGWGREAGRRAAARRTPAPALTVPTPDAPDAVIDAYAARDPLGARRLGWDEALGAWGAAVERGDSAAAARHLRHAALLGAALGRGGGDGTLAEAVETIEAAGREPAALRRLARAHRLFALGQRRRWYLAAADNAGAREAYAAARAAAAPGSAVARWASVELGVTLALADTVPHGRGERLLRAATAASDTVRHPALAARAHWALATTVLRQGRHDEGMRALAVAARLFERIGEREHLGAMQTIAADNAFASGDRAGGYAMAHRALLTLRSRPAAVWRHSALYIAARAAMTDGLRHAAARLQDEGIEAARRGRAQELAEALLARARLRAATSDLQAAAADVQVARPIVHALPEQGLRGWLGADLRLAEAMLGSPADAATLAALDLAIAFFSAPPNPTRLVPALVARAEAHVATGRSEAAAEDLDRALALLDGQAANIANAMLRALLHEGARRVTERAVLSHLADGRTARALEALERGRATFSAGAAQRAAVRESGPLRLRLGPGRAALSYTLVGDTLLVWVVADGTAPLARREVDGERLRRLIEQARGALERRSPEALTRGLLAALHDELVQPVERWLPAGVERLVVAADGDLAGVPFAALYDRARAEYLIERYTLSVASSLRDAAHHATLPTGRGGAVPGEVLVVADPAFDARAFPELEPLPLARAEAAAVAGLYDHRLLLSGSDARRSALEAELGGVDVLHFAGHAVLDDRRPEQSLLLLAPEPGGDGRLPAADIARLDLGRVRLVVLSACETLRGRRGSAASGFGGLAGAFLAAGSAGVVGSLWPVDDGLTAALMVHYHRAYRESGDGALALRNAQLVLLQSSDPALRSPAAWAGFHYAGR